MKLRGQLRGAQGGYAMVTLLISMSVMAVLMSAAMPSWRHLVQREKEAELIFRGEQYARAIGLFQRRAGPGVNPPNLDVLVQQRYLRKKYKDPITGDDFDLITPMTAAAGTVPNLSAGRAGRGQTQPAGRMGQAVGQLAQAARGIPGAPAAGGIVGVASKSKEKSIRLYNGRNFYNEWQFVYVPQTQQPGGEGARGSPGGPGGRGPRGGPPVGPGPIGPGRRGGFDPRGGGGSPPAPPQRPQGR